MDTSYLKLKVESYDALDDIKMVFFVYDDGSYDLLGINNKSYDMIRKGIIEINNILRISNIIIKDNLHNKRYIHPTMNNSTQRITIFDKEETIYIIADTLAKKPFIIDRFIQMFESFMLDAYQEFYG